MRCGDMPRRQPDYGDGVRHIRPEGLAVLRQLSLLGEALGYEVREEHRVGRSAAVDLSWTAADSNDVPLFVFEVETTVSAGLANNALKVFGSPLDELAKPLFFFHIVLSGGADNERVRNAQLAWGQHNYRVYRWADDGQALQLAMDVLRQHRRVQRYIEPLAVARALEGDGWGGVETAIAALELAEALQFDGPYRLGYACLAVTHADYLELFARRVRMLAELPAANEMDEGARHLSREHYGGQPGDYVPGLLETALRVYAGDVTDKDGPAAFEQWATACGYGRRMIEPSFGLSRDYDVFLIGTAPIHYALAACLLRDMPRSRDWVLQDCASLLEGERDCGLQPMFRVPTVLWLAHSIAATEPTDAAGPPTFMDLEQLYSTLDRHVADGAGIPAELLLCPPGPFNPNYETPDWAKDGQGVPLPPLLALRTTTRKHLGTRRIIQTPLTACVGALTSYEVYVDPGRDLLPLIYASQRA